MGDTPQDGGEMRGEHQSFPRGKEAAIHGARAEERDFLKKI
jgi:hypothetical protein